MRSVIAWLPIASLPTAILLVLLTDWPRWAFMWLFAGSIYVGCKWLTWSMTCSAASGWRQLGYLVLWPGMDADAFLGASTKRSATWLFAVAKLVFGIALVWVVVPIVSLDAELLRGWVGMIGIVFLLHFGLFDLLRLAWNSAGVDAKPIMDWPIAATSVSEFWGRRWNRAFRDLTHRYLFRPLTTRFGPRIALLLGFLVSGLVHDLVISLPAGGGWGGPTVFFLVQTGAIFLERSPRGARLGLGKGAVGWAFTMFVLLVPVGLLFHPPFVRGVVVPFLDVLTMRGVP